jgi:hypothetical protein
VTRQQLVEWLVANPAVVRANTTVGPNGQAVLPTATALQAIADRAIELTVGNLLTYESVLRAIGTRSKDYTLTDATVPIPDGDNVGEIVCVTIGDAKKPLRQFTNPADFSQWYYENVGDEDDATDEPVGFHMFTSTAGVQQLTIVPGIGDDTTLTVWYLRQYTHPFDISVFPATIASILATGCIETITGGEFSEGYQNAIARLAKRLTRVVPVPIPLRHSEEYETHWKTRNEDLAKLF